MATSYGPQFPGIQDGLIFCFDPKNRECWNGGTNFTDLVKGTTLIGVNMEGDEFTNILTTEGSISMDGTDDYINFGSPSTGTGVHTISFWANIEVETDDDRFISNTNDNNFSIAMGATSTGNVQVWGNNWHTLFATPAAGTWNHYCFTFDGSTNITGYLNGVAGNTVSTPYNFSNLGLGARLNLQFGDEFDGKFGPFLLYNRVLSTEEITTNYNRLKTRFGL